MPSLRNSGISVGPYLGLASEAVAWHCFAIQSHRDVRVAELQRDGLCERARPKTGPEHWPTAVDRQIDSLLKQPVALSSWIVEATRGLASQFNRNRGIFRLGIEVASLNFRDNADTPSTRMKPADCRVSLRRNVHPAFLTRPASGGYERSKTSVLIDGQFRVFVSVGSRRTVRLSR